MNVKFDAVGSGRVSRQSAFGFGGGGEVDSFLTLSVFLFNRNGHLLDVSSQ